MYKTIAVTNRKLCENPFLEQMEKVAKSKPDVIILREKDLGEVHYEKLAKEVLAICKTYEVECMLHTYAEVAKKLNHPRIHLPWHLFVEEFIEKKNNVKNFKEIGVSIHSLEEALMAENCGATYLIAGHIFQTDCKKDLMPRGISFLKRICECVQIPVYAIGGIDEQNITQVIEAGAKGACRMSAFMKG